MRTQLKAWLSIATLEDVACCLLSYHALRRVNAMTVPVVLQTGMLHTKMTLPLRIQKKRRSRMLEEAAMAFPSS